MVLRDRKNSWTSRFDKKKCPTAGHRGRDTGAAKRTGATGAKPRVLHLRDLRLTISQSLFNTNVTGIPSVLIFFLHKTLSFTQGLEPL